MKTKIIITLSFFYLSLSKAQVPDEPMTISEYPAFYAQTVNKLNNIIPNKTNYYGQPLSAFLNVLNQNNIIVKKYNPAPFNNKLLELSFFWNMDVRIAATNNNYAQPHIAIYFQQPFNYQLATTMMSTNGYHSYWNPQAENFFNDLIIDKIEFWYVRGLTDNSANPK